MSELPSLVIDNAVLTALGDNNPSSCHDSDDSLNIMNRYMKKVNKFEILDEALELELAVACHNGNIAAAHRLITSHLRLVVKIAFSYRYYGLSTMDLISEGNLGLAHAVKKFNPESGNRFSTYAMWWIRAAIQSFILHSWSLVRVGTTAIQRKLFFSLNKIKRQLGLGPSDTLSATDIKMIQHCTGAKAAEVVSMDQRLSYRDAAMSDPVYGANGAAYETSYEDILPCNKAGEALEDVVIRQLDASIDRAALYHAMSNLSERERYIIKARLLCDGKAATLEQISQTFSISKERVRQITEGALKKLKKALLSPAGTRINSRRKST